MADDAPHPLGLIPSTDRAIPWGTWAFARQEDFHSIDAADDFTYTDAADGRLLMSTNWQAPTQVTAAPPLAVVDRTSIGDIVGANLQGQAFISSDDGASWAHHTTFSTTPGALSVRATAWYAANTQGACASIDRQAHQLW